MAKDIDPADKANAIVRSDLLNLPPRNLHRANTSTPNPNRIPLILMLLKAVSLPTTETHLRASYAGESVHTVQIRLPNPGNSWSGSHCPPAVERVKGPAEGQAFIPTWAQTRTATQTLCFLHRSIIS